MAEPSHHGAEPDLRRAPPAPCAPHTPRSRVSSKSIARPRPAACGALAAPSSRARSTRPALKPRRSSRSWPPAVPRGAALQHALHCGRLSRPRRHCSRTGRIYTDALSIVQLCPRAA
jgi:hypothetical protein